MYETPQLGAAICVQRPHLAARPQPARKCYEFRDGFTRFAALRSYITSL